MKPPVVYRTGGNVLTKVELQDIIRLCVGYEIKKSDLYLFYFKILK